MVDNLHLNQLKKLAKQNKIKRFFLVSDLSNRKRRKILKTHGVSDNEDMIFYLDVGSFKGKKSGLLLTTHSVHYKSYWFSKNRHLEHQYISNFKFAALRIWIYNNQNQLHQEIHHPIIKTKRLQCLIESVYSYLRAEGLIDDVCIEIPEEPEQLVEEKVVQPEEKTEEANKRAVRCLGCKAIVRADQSFCEYCRTPI